MVPDSVDFAMCTAWTYFTDFQFGWNGDPDRNFAHCLQLGEALMRRQPEHPLALALWGRLSLWQRDYRGAVDAFSATAALRPQDAGMLSNVADAFMRAGRPSEALEFVNRAHQIQPGNRGVLHAVEGNIRFALGDLDGAMAAFETARRRNPALCAAHGGLAAVLAELGRIDAARDAARQAEQAGDLRVSIDFMRDAVPFADPGLRHRWVRAWQLADVPLHDARLRQAAA
jgi:tetratricopeptide (TPR) repeat protein